MIKISIISKDKNLAHDLNEVIGKHYFINGIYRNIDSIVNNKLSSSKPLLIIYCNNEQDDLFMLKKSFDRSKIIIYNNLENYKLFFSAIQVGVKSFVHHSQKTSELLDVIEIVSLGGSYVSNAITYKLFEYIKDISDLILGKRIREYDLLSDREIMVYELIIGGYSYKDIATSLSISIDTVRKHISRVYRKLKINNKGELYNLHYNIIVKSPKYKYLFLQQNNQLSI